MGINILLTKGMVAIIGNRDADLSRMKWCYANNKKKPDGYAAKSIGPRGTKTRFMHKIIAERMGLAGTIDHKDGNRLNNRRSNLRLCT